MRTFTPLIITTLITPWILACGPGAPPLATTGDGSTTQATTAFITTTTATPTTTTDTTGTSTSTTGDLSTGDASSTNAQFIVMPDGGGDCFAGPADPDHQLRCLSCDIFLQDCSGGDKCVPWADGGGSTFNDTRCSPVLGTGVAGDPCTAEGSGTSGFDDCDFGHICWDVDDQLHGTCVAMCTGSQAAPECPAPTGCLIANDGVLAVCLPTCDPLLQDCPPTDTCVQATDSPFLCVPDLSGPGGQANDPCAFITQCDPGLQCADPGSTSSACDQNASGCCSPFCTLPDGPCPNPDQGCVPWYPVGEAPAGEEDIGACALPPP